MIVDSMTLEEITTALRDDFVKAAEIALFRLKKFQSIALKTKSFPLIRHYECTTPQNKNRFFAQFSVYKHSDWKNPTMRIYCIYGRPEGSYCASLGLNDSMYLYTPHLFSRYRERVIKRDDISNENLIHLFIERHRDYWGFPADYAEDLLGDCDEEERLSQEEQINWILTHLDGVLFGTQIGKVFIIKTIVTESMLRPEQLELIEDMYSDYVAYAEDECLNKKIKSILGFKYDDYTQPKPATQEAINKLSQKYKKQ